MELRGELSEPQLSRVDGTDAVAESLESGCWVESIRAWNVNWTDGPGDFCILHQSEKALSSLKTV